MTRKVAIIRDGITIAIVDEKCSLKECDVIWYKDCWWEYLCKKHYRLKNLLKNILPNIIIVVIFIIIYLYRIH